MLNSPALKSPDREFSFPQLSEVAVLHEMLHAGLNDVVNHRLNDCFAIHLKTPLASSCGSGLPAASLTGNRIFQPLADRAILQLVQFSAAIGDHGRNYRPRLKSLSTKVN